MMSRRPCWKSKLRNGGYVGGVKYSFGIELYFYANPSFCFIMQIWLLVTWANTLYATRGLLVMVTESEIRAANFRFILFLS